MSLLFYAWGEPVYIVIMVLSILINYVMGLLIDKEKRNGIKNFWFICALIVDVGVLIAFKYSSFIVENINGVFRTSIPVPNLSLPIGISFFTFQIVSYIVDLRYCRIRVQKSLIDLALYISMFPQLIAGPIVRYSKVENELKNRSISQTDIYMGIVRFSIGLMKKVLIADRIAPIADYAFSLPMTDLSTPFAWIGAFAYTLQIYFDFSGYSDMAIGLGLMLGFHFDENFNYPYISKSIKEFWTRWHISLSGWFKDYVYIPLGGSRCNNVKIIRNYILVFFLTGLWHGASWNFVAWGLYYVVFLLGERFIYGKFFKKIPVFIQHLYAFIIIMIGWVLFRADNLKHAFLYITDMFSINNANTLPNLGIFDKEILAALIVGAITCTPIIRWAWTKYKKIRVLLCVLGCIGWILSLLYVLCSDFSPFLYFRF